MSPRRAGSGTSRRAPLRGGRLLEAGQLLLEVGHVLEVLVDRREAQVGDRVQGSQALQDGQADGLAWDLGAELAHLLLDLGRDLVDRTLDRAASHRLGDAAGELRPDERLLDSGALGDDERERVDPLVGGEPAPAAEALPAAPDGVTLVGDARVHDLVVVLPAVGTPHSATVAPPLATGSGMHGDGLADLERPTVPCRQQLVDDRTGIAVRGDLPRDVPRRVAGLDEVADDRRGAPGSREG